MEKIICILLLITSINSFGQEKFNLDFETTESNMPLNWESFGSNSYSISIDTINSHSGKNSAVIEYDGDSPEYKAWSYSIPAKYGGDKIKLSGYLKTENVRDGWAGLWLRIDPGVAFDNMQNRGITGTTDWIKYEVELDLKPNQAQQIVFGGLLVGKGKIWLDDFTISIDGVGIEKAKPRELLPAELDTTFNAGSDIVFPELDRKLINDLELLGKIWGFLKYH
ncbi:MAG: peptidase S41, partial [Bacteroidetes bacterium]|nr:peptidase S41 [Bacteroidota bacterium]